MTSSLMPDRLPQKLTAQDAKKLAQRKKAQNFHDSWWGKSLAGVFLGLPLCFALSSSLFYTDLSSKTADGNIQLTMWFTVIFWVVLLSFVYLFRSAKSAWGWLSLICAIAFAVLWWVKIGWANA